MLICNFCSTWKMKERASCESGNARRVASSATGWGGGDWQTAMFGSGGRTCRRGQSRPDGARARTCVEQEGERGREEHWTPPNSVRRCRRDRQGRADWRYSRASRRSDVAVATPHLVIARCERASKQAESGRGRRHRARGVRARVLAQAISQPVANVVLVLGISPAGPRSSSPSAESCSRALARARESVLRAEFVYDAVNVVRWKCRDNRRSAPSETGTRDYESYICVRVAGARQISRGLKRQRLAQKFVGDNRDGVIREFSEC